MGTHRTPPFTDREFETPMMQQYMAQKRQHTDCLLLFRMGDFYELFLDDAKVGADVLNITLTQRAKGRDGEVPMAGVPHHALDAYLSKLVNAGYRVAICDQVSEADNSPNLVQREVIRIVTPGTLLDETSLESKQHNFTASIALDLEQTQLSLACADLSTGDIFIHQRRYDDDPTAAVAALLEQHRPREVMYAPTHRDHLHPILEQHDYLVHAPSERWDDHVTQTEQLIHDSFGVETVEGLGLHEAPLKRTALAGILGYLKHTQRNTSLRFSALHHEHDHDALQLDRSTMVNLELFETIRQGNRRGSFIDVFDHTDTAMGGRLLRRWIQRPLIEKNAITARHDAVAWLLQRRQLHDELRDNLRAIGDVERLVRRLQLGTGTPPTVVRLKQALQHARDTAVVLQERARSDEKNEDPLPTAFTTALDSFDTAVDEIIEYIDTQISDDPPHDPSKGSVFKRGVHDELDDLMETIQTSKDWIATLQADERERTGVQSLKVDSNKVHGYYIEISKANLDAVPDEYERRQTLVNAERFITPALKKHEAIITEHAAQAQRIEARLFEEVLARLDEAAETLKAVANAIATIDALSSHTSAARQPGMIRPELTDDTMLEITQGRHPVVEQLLDAGAFVPNDVSLSSQEENLAVVTGPNMAGKSVYMRQTALIILMAHIGAYVPATAARIGLTDRIFVRSGAADSITSGLSTFMVEMTEAAYILNHLTERSFIIFAEIGRGTSTFDGISIAWAIAQHLVAPENPHPRTLFATHYHELQSLAAVFPERVKNLHLLIDEETDDNGPRFLHVVTDGAAPHSFGVAVARRAGVPKVVTDTAAELLKTLEHADYTQQFSKQVREILQEQSAAPQEPNSNSTQTTPSQQPADTATSTPPSIDPILKELAALEVNHLTPLEALQLVDRLHSQARKQTHTDKASNTTIDTSTTETDSTP